MPYEIDGITYYTVRDLRSYWNPRFRLQIISFDTIRRACKDEDGNDEPGIIRRFIPNRNGFKRRRPAILIPESVVEQIWLKVIG